MKTKYRKVTAETHSDRSFETRAGVKLDVLAYCRSFLSSNRGRGYRIGYEAREVTVYFRLVLPNENTVNLYSKQDIRPGAFLRPLTFSPELNEILDSVTVHGIEQLNAFEKLANEAVVEAMAKAVEINARAGFDLEDYAGELD